jgi:hypothetical protein
MLTIRLTGGTPLVTIDLISANNASLGFTPNYISKRSEANSHWIAARRVQASDDDVSKSRSKASNKILDIWCNWTKGKGWGCNGQYGKNTYSQVPIVGTIYTEDYVPRK